MGKDKKGFTLIELIIVIAILALLMVIAVPSIVLISNKINNKVYDTRVTLILSAAETYAKDNYAALFGDGAVKANIQVKTLMPKYLVPDEKRKNETTGLMEDVIIDKRNDTSMNERTIWLTRKNTRIVATLDEDSIIPVEGDDDGGPTTPEDTFDFSNGHIILAAYLDGSLYTTDSGMAIPTPSVTSFDAPKSRCNGGSVLNVVVDETNNKYKATVSSIRKQTICMLYFITKG